MLQAHRPHDIVGRGGADLRYAAAAAALCGQTENGVKLSEGEQHGAESVTSSGIGAEQQQSDAGDHSQRIDAICNRLSRTDEYPTLGGVVVKQERGQDSSDGGYCSSVTQQQPGHTMASDTEPMPSNANSQQSTAALPGIHEVFSHRSPFRQRSPTIVGVAATSAGFSQSMPDYIHHTSAQGAATSHEAPFPVAGQTQAPRHRPTAQLPPIAQVI